MNRATLLLLLDEGGSNTSRDDSVCLAKIVSFHFLFL